MSDNTDDLGDSFNAQDEIAEITRTSNFAKCSIDTLKQCWQCYQLPAICPRIRDFFNESLS